MTDTTQIKLLLNGLAEYYGINLTPNQLAMYSEDLADMDLGSLGNAIKQIRKTEQFFPRPAQIRQHILGTEKDEAIEASNRIIEAMTRFGWTNPEGARAFIGELGWRVVQREGGWLALCERTTNDDLPTLKAQWREMARVTAARARRGCDDLPPGLPDPTGPVRIGAGLFKSLEDKRDA